MNPGSTLKFTICLITINKLFVRLEGACKLPKQDETHSLPCRENASTYKSEFRSTSTDHQTRNESRDTDNSRISSVMVATSNRARLYKKRQRERRSTLSLTWSFYTHASHEFQYYVPTYVLKRCFPHAKFRLARYNTDEYTWLRYDSFTDRITGFPMHGDEGKYLLTLKWHSTGSYGANGEAKLILYVRSNPKNRLYFVRFWLEHRAYHMAEDMTERQMFVHQLIMYLRTYAVKVKSSDVIIHHIGAISGLVEWSLAPESIEKSCAMGNKFASILPSYNSAPSSDLMSSLRGFDQVVEVNVSLSYTCRNYKKVHMSRFQKLMPIAILFVIVVLGPIILSLAIRRCYKSSHPCPKSGQQDYIFYKIPPEQRRNEPIQQPHTMTNKRKTARQETDEITDILKLSAIPEKIEIEHIRNTFRSHTAFALTNDVFAKMYRKDKRVNNQRQGEDLLCVQAEVSDTLSDTFSDRVSPSNYPVEDICGTPKPSPPSVTFNIQKPTVYIDAYNFV